MLPARRMDAVLKQYCISAYRYVPTVHASPLVYIRPLYFVYVRVWFSYRRQTYRHTGRETRPTDRETDTDTERERETERAK